jgi:hypothetical protein
LVGTFKEIPVQRCQFHQVAAIRRYTTKNSKMLASMKLKIHVTMLKNTHRESFEGGLKIGFIKWENFLNERSLIIENR